MSESHPVRLRLYDLSRGMAKAMSMMMIGTQIDGIWHSGIEVYGHEYFFGGNGCNKALPSDVERDHQMKPVDVIELGRTEIPQEVFEEFIRDAQTGRFNGSKYDLLNNNCNNFADEASQFLVGSGIPSHIIELPRKALSTPLGQQLMPLLQSMGATSSPIPFQTANQAPQATATPTQAPPKAAAPAAAAATRPQYPTVASILKAINDEPAYTLDVKKNAVATVGKLLANLAKDPANPKFAVVSSSVAAIQKLVGGIGQLGWILLDRVGFKAPVDVLTFDFTSGERVDFAYHNLDQLEGSPELQRKLADMRDLVTGYANTNLTNGAHSGGVHTQIPAPNVTGSPSSSSTSDSASNPGPAGNFGGLAGMAQQLMSNPAVRGQAAALLSQNPGLASLASSLLANQGGAPGSGGDLAGLLGGFMNAAAPQQPQTVPTATAGGSSSASPSSMTAEERSKVEAIQGMGFTDVARVRQALQAAGGDVTRAVTILCSM